MSKNFENHSEIYISTTFRFCWARPIKGKNKEELLNQLKKMFKSIKTFDTIQTDGELWWTKDFFASKNTHLVI